MRIVRSKSVCLIAAVPLILFGGLLTYVFAYLPARVSYLMHRVESAKTAAEEREALELAWRSGAVWEVLAKNVSTGRYAANQRGADAMVKDPHASVDLELEFLDRSIGGGYRARRILIDKRNLYVIFGEPPP